MFPINYRINNGDRRAPVVAHATGAHRGFYAAGRTAVVLPDALVDSGQSADAPVDARLLAEEGTQVGFGSPHVWIYKFIGRIDTTEGRRLQHPQVRFNVYWTLLDGGVVLASGPLARLSLRSMKGRGGEADQTSLVAE